MEQPATLGEGAEHSGIKVPRAAYRTPQMIARRERFLGSVRRERLDHLIILRAAAVQ